MWAKTFEGHCSKGFALGSGLAWTTWTHGFEKFSVIGAAFSGNLIRYLWPSMATSANGTWIQDAEAFPLLRVMSGMIWPKDLCGMLQGARMPLITSSYPPEHCLGALPNLTLYPPSLSLRRGAWFRSYGEVWCSDAQTTPASLPGNTTHCPSMTKVKEGREGAPPRPCSPTFK